MNRRKHLLHSLGRSTSFAWLPLKAKLLWAMLVAAVDDQGRFEADEKPVKWAVCPNVDDIATDEIAELLRQMEEQDMVHLYEQDGVLYGQFTRWWKYQAPSYARPSDYPAPPGWRDRVRIRKGEEWVQENWKGKGGFEGVSDH